MSVDETLAMARETVERLGREIAEKEQAHYNDWLQDASDALTEGRQFYQPVLAVVPGNSSDDTPRAKRVESAMQAIVEAGWQLHTWSVIPKNASIGSFAVAHPLFVRGEGMTQ